jgi:hypothetical protein
MERYAKVFTTRMAELDGFGQAAERLHALIRGGCWDDKQLWR